LKTIVPTPNNLSILPNFNRMSKNKLLSLTISGDDTPVVTLVY